MSQRKFKKIYIEITNVCNLSCSFCPKTERKARFMERELFTHILNQIQGQTRFLYFHVLGEPLLHPSLGEYLDLCHGYGFQVNITTNGTLIPENAQMLLTKPALRQINFSLHSFSANEHGFSMDLYLDHILNFIWKSKESTNLKICLRLWNLQEGYITKNNRFILNRIEKEFSLEEKLEEKLTPCNGIKLSENVFLNQSLTFTWPNPALQASGKENGFCYGLRDQAAILVDGTVVPCCLDGEGVINLGNIREQSFQEIISSSRAQRLYSEFSNRKVAEPLCQTCDYRTRFNL